MPFLQDDFVFANSEYMYNNEYKPSVKIEFPQNLYYPRGHQCYWRPLTQHLWLAYTLKSQAIPSNVFPLIAHIISIILFWICCVEVYFLSYLFVDLLFPNKEKKQKYDISKIIAIIYASRPIWFLGVVWASGQQELIGLIFSLGAILFFYKNYFMFSGILYFLALLSKENAVLTLVVLFPLIFFNSTYKINKKYIWGCFAFPTILYAVIRIAFITPLLEPLPIASPPEMIKNFIISVIMLFDINREIIRNFVYGKNLFIIAAGFSISISVILLYIFVIRKIIVNYLKTKFVERKKIIVFVICCLICLIPACLLTSTPYGYYLMYCGILFYCLIGIGISSLKSKTANIILVAFILSGILGVIYQIYSPQGNYNRAIQSAKHRKLLKGIHLPQNMIETKIFGFTKNEIWAMGWGLGISLKKQGDGGKNQPFDRNKIKFIADEELGCKINPKDHITIIIFKKDTTCPEYIKIPKR